METAQLERFAQDARRQLMMQVSAKLEQVLTTDSAILRENQSAVKKVRDWVEEDGKDAVIEKAAYTWFNRLCAFRYMDVKSYSEIGIISPASGFSQPEVLQDAKSNLFPKDWQVNRQRVADLLSGKLPSPNGEQEAYRLLLVAACNAWANELPFLFNRITEELELLMPEDLLSNLSVASKIREVLTPETCQDVEVIGWLYQFYISEKKDEVMAAKGAVAPQDIPAVTQLFTPDWIVRYMVQNSLGRLWLLNHPNSAIRSQMDYYIEPAEPEADYLKVSSPEELKVLDPACGSGHILTYAFDLLYAIYEEQGYDPLRIPRLILEKNLYGIEIDQRAAQLAAFALMMKAMQRDRRFLTRGIQPNVLEMENIRFTPQEQLDLVEAIGTDLYTASLWEGVQQFEEAKTYGSLIRPVIRDGATIRERMREKGVMDQLLLFEPGRRLLKVLEMSEYLSPRYQVVVANPPYFSKGDGDYKQFAERFYKDSKTDSGTMFIERNLELAIKHGYVGMITLMSWMFLSSFERLRQKLIDEKTLMTMAHLGARAFDSIGGEVVSTTAFVLSNNPYDDFSGDYFRLIDGNSEEEKQNSLQEAITNPDCGWFYRASAQDFKKIPGVPIIYWFSSGVLKTFEWRSLGKLVPVYTGMATSDNARFLRYWYEVSNVRVDYSASSIEDTKRKSPKWYPFNKGGEWRKWYGNFDYVVNFANSGKEIKEEVNRKYPYLRGNTGFYIRYEDQYFKEGLTWSAVSSGKFAVRLHSKNSIFSNAGFVAIPKANLFYYIALLNSNIAFNIIGGMSQTLNFNASDISKFPTIVPGDKGTINMVEELANQCINLCREDWDAFEVSWNFTQHPLISNDEE